MKRYAVIVITGKGGAFSAGGDVKDMASMKESSWDLKKRFWEQVYRPIFSLETLKSPYCRH